MATCLTRTYTLLRVGCGVRRHRFGRVYRSQVSSGEVNARRWWRSTIKGLGLFAGAITACGSFLYFLDRSVVKAMGLEIKIPNYPWSFDGLFMAHDHAALRRGWEVYKTVCRTCHSLRYVKFLDFVNITHTRDEAKAIAAEYEVEDGPDSEGEYYTRPCILTDAIPDPFPNEEAAKVANNGSYPPDLSLIVRARKNGQNYMFSLLCGWIPAPAGVQLSDTQHFNIYFPGQVTTMADMLFDGMVDYEDGTPSYRSQMVKDVVEFLTWTASQDHDERKIIFTRFIGACLILLACAYHMNRQKWSVVRSRQIAYVPKRKW